MFVSVGEKNKGDYFDLLKKIVFFIDIKLLNIGVFIYFCKKYMVWI